MAYSKIALSLPGDILAWLDQMAAAQQQSRSGFIREVLEARRAQEEHERVAFGRPSSVMSELEAPRTQEEYEQIIAEWKAIYDEINDDEVAMSEAWLANSIAPTLEPYDWTPEERDAFSAAR